MILTHPKKEKVNPWSMTTLDKLNSEKTNFGSGSWVLSAGRRQRTKSSKHPVTKIVFHSGGTGISSGLTMPWRKCPSRLWPLLIPCTPATYGLRVLQSMLIVEKLEEAPRSADQEHFFLLGNIIPLFSCKIHSNGYLHGTCM